MSKTTRGRTPRQSWIDEGLRALAAGGPDAVRVEALARALGVSKGGFYWHFDDRPALLDELLDSWERMGVDNVIAFVDSEGGDARTRLRRLFSLVSDEVVQIDLAVRNWARTDRDVARRLKRIDKRRMAYMRSLFGQFCADDEDVEARCVLAMALFVGHHFMAPDRAAARDEMLRVATKKLLA